MYGDWEKPDPAELRIMGKQEDWDALVAKYAEGRDALPRPLRRCLEVARAGGASTVVIETRYLDPDYRSEHRAFHSQSFASVPDTTHRLHFFKAVLTQDQLWQLPDYHGYLGYVVIRPYEFGPVGRTMLAPPPGLAPSIRTLVTDHVNFFGQDLAVTGVPFMQQDTQLSRCAHAAAWMCHYAGYLRGDTARQATSEFAVSADSSLGTSRVVPSEGMTDRQLLDLFRRFGLPAVFYRVDNLGPFPRLEWQPPDPTPPPKEDIAHQHPGHWDWRLIPIICRYLNSGYPVLVGAGEHAFVICGYTRTRREGDRDWITFIRHDDQGGPYLQVDRPLEDVDPETGHVYSPWEMIFAPLPAKLWLTPEPVETTGGRLLRGLSNYAADRVPEAAEIETLIGKQRLALRTYACRANDYKAGLIRRRLPTELVREYRLARLSRFVWVVEAIDRDRRQSNPDACVLGEAIFDATSNERSPRPMALHVPGFAALFPLGSKAYSFRCVPDGYQSGASGTP